MVTHQQVTSMFELIIHQRSAYHEVEAIIEMYQCLLYIGLFSVSPSDDIAQLLQNFIAYFKDEAILLVLGISEDPKKPSSPVALYSLRYALMMQLYEVTINFHIAKCEPNSYDLSLLDKYAVMAYIGQAGFVHKKQGSDSISIILCSYSNSIAHSIHFSHFTCHS